MKKIDTRAALTYLGITVVGLFLLLLVSPSIGGPSWLFGPLTVAFAVLPLLVILTLATFVFGKSKRSERILSRNISQGLGVTAVAGTMLSLFFTYISTQHAVSFTRTQSVLENTGVAFLFLAYACTLILMNRQRFVYWPFWNTKDKAQADERERSVRNRVFEKSYRIMILLGFFVASLAQTPSQRMHHELLQASILCLFGLPSVVASWQKDS